MRLLPEAVPEEVAAAAVAEADVLEEGRALALAHLDAKTLRELGL